MNSGSTLYYASAGVIVVPMEILAGIVNTHGRINLSVNGELQLGYVLYRPYQESEAFIYEDAISERGEFVHSTYNIRTDYVDVEGAVEFVYSGKSSKAANRRVYAYDANKNPVKTLYNGGPFQSNVHITYDGTYKYIVASSLKDVAYSLVVYFRNRGH